ncbi:hypothetical protein QTN25_006182 [Entamoeba marina]
METYQLHDIIHTDEEFDGVHFIEYNTTHKLFAYSNPHYYLLPHAHKIKKLHFYHLNRHFEQLVERFKVIRSLMIIVGFWGNSDDIELLLLLKNVCTLRELTLYLSTKINMDVIIELHKLLPNVKLSLVFLFNSYNVDSLSKQFIESIPTIPGVNMYFSELNENVLTKQVVLFEIASLPFKTLLSYKEDVNNILYKCYPSELYILNDETVDETNDETVDETNDETVDETNDVSDDDSIENIDFSESTMLQKLTLNIPKKPTTNICLPTTLTYLSINNNGNIGIPYNTISSLPLQQFTINKENNKEIVLPSTLSILSILSCSFCSFSFNSKWCLKFLEVTSNNCVVPICDTVEEIRYEENDNTYVWYGEQTKIYQLISNSSLKTINISDKSIYVSMKQNAFIDIFDVSLFNNYTVSFNNINCNKIICKNHPVLWFKSIHAKEIVFESTTRFECDNIKSIGIIKGDIANKFTFLNSTQKPQLLIKQIDTCRTQVYNIPQCKLQLCILFNIKENIVDLSPFQISKIVFQQCVIQHVILPPSIEEFEDDISSLSLVENIAETKIVNNLKNKMKIKYCNGILPPFCGKHITIKEVHWEILDTRNSGVEILSIYCCKKLKSILFGKSVKNLIIYHCDMIETLDLTGVPIQVLSLKNCSALSTLLVNDSAKKVIKSCPLIK